MAVVFFIVGIILLILILVWFINNSISINNMLWHFKHGNVIVGGKKGKGKDLLFNYVIHKRHDYYYSNIDYSLPRKMVKADFKTLKVYSADKVNQFREIISLQDVSVYPNTYNNFVKERYEIINRRFIDGKDIYISDIGNFLPSYMDSTLYKQFPSMPLLYSLSRHLYANNIHCNTQNIERGWKALREQADFFVIVKRTYKIFGLLITKCYSYDKYDSAVKGLMPIKKRMLNKFSKANVDLYQAQNGDIRKFFVFQRTCKVTYDTRAFEKFVFDDDRLVYNKADFIPKQEQDTQPTAD